MTVWKVLQVVKGAGENLLGGEWLLDEVAGNICAGKAMLDDVGADLLFIIGDTKTEGTLADALQHTFIL